MHKDIEQEILPDSLDNPLWHLAPSRDEECNLPPPRILMMADITGAGPGYHVGDEAMAEVAIERLKALVGAENLVMACARPDAVPSTYGISAFAYYNRTDRERRRLWRRRPLSALKSAAVMLYQLVRSDVVFVCGGGNLTSVWPAVLESRLHLFRWALRLKKRLFLVSQTLGPFSEEHRDHCQRVLARADWIGVRDRDFSRRQIGLPVHFAVDDAAFLEPKHSDRSRKILPDRRPALALSLRKFGRANRQCLLDLGAVIDKLAKRHQLATIFVPHHSPRGQGDTAIAKDVQQQWSQPSSFTVVEPIMRASELKALTADCKLVISMRYHQLVFALSTGVPAIGIYVDQYTKAKLNGAFEQFGLEPRIVSIHKACEGLEPLVQDVLKDEAQFRSAAATVRDALPRNLRSIQLLGQQRASA